MSERLTTYSVPRLYNIASVSLFFLHFYSGELYHFAFVYGVIVFPLTATGL